MCPAAEGIIANLRTISVPSAKMEMEFSIKLSAGAEAFIASAGGEAHYRVHLKWQREQRMVTKLKSGVELKSCIVRIWRTTGEMVSAGFVVGKAYLTCAHVVTEALGLAHDHREVYIRQGKKRKNYEVRPLLYSSSGDSPGVLVSSTSYFRSLLFLSPSFILR